MLVDGGSDPRVGQLKKKAAYWAIQWNLLK